MFSVPPWFVLNQRWRMVVKRILVVSTTVVGLALSLLVQTHAQNRVSSIPSGGTPLLPDNLVNGPVPVSYTHLTLPTIYSV